ncbi:MAG: O-antigen ligase family protein [Thermodesulfobacteriota bacterium]
MFDHLIRVLLMSLLIFTPIAFGAVEVWASSLMELGILLVLALWAFKSIFKTSEAPAHSASPEPSSSGEGRRGRPSILGIRSLRSAIPIILLSCFLLLVLAQFLRLPVGWVRMISPKTYALRNSLSLYPLTSEISLSLVPSFTQIEFLKWLTLSGLFLFLLNWEGLGRRRMRYFILVIMSVGILESLYGMFEFFSGHRHILNLEGESLVSSVTGTFTNRNYFAGYLLMVIPLSLAYLFSREQIQDVRSEGWRSLLSFFDGGTLLISFGIIVMMLGLLFSASRMGMMSLLLSFSLIHFLFFRGSRRPRRISKGLGLFFSLAVLWAAAIGLDAVISRFFTSSEDFEIRWKIWANTFQILKDFPLLGTGLGTFVHIFPMYLSFPLWGLVSHTENDFLQLASEVGILGIGILLTLFIILFSKAISGIRSRRSRDPQRSIGIACLVGIIALMIHSLLERNLQIPANAFLFTFIWSLVLRISRGNALVRSRVEG